MPFHKNIINLSAKTIPFYLLKNLSKENVIFPFYHTVSDLYLPHIKHLYNYRNTKEFKKDLDFLLKHYIPVDISDLKHISEKPGKSKFILSFDDGLSQIYETIAPILIKKGIPAIFFINSDFADNKNLFFKHKISIIIDEISKNQEKQKIISKTFETKKKFYKQLKKNNFTDNDFLTEIAKSINIDFKNFLQTNKPYLSSKQILSLKSQGFSIGAHSINHPEYRFLNTDEQIRQTKESIDFVQKKFNQNLKLFAFPFTDFGIKKTFFNKIFSENIVDYSFGTAGIKKDMYKRNIQRIPIEKHNSAKNSLKFELLYSLIKKIAGKNIIIRN